MKDSYQTPARQFAPGMGEAVANRTITRKKPDGTVENWADVAERVAHGNSLLASTEIDQFEEFHALHHHLRQASIIMSGRHLQHGDDTQHTKNAEVYTNCSTSSASFISFLLLLSGSGVGRAVDDAMMKVDWRKLPILVPVIDHTHPDALSGEINALNLKDARHLYADNFVRVHEVEDSREGWAKAIELIERLAFEGEHRQTVLILDFSKVRCRNTPIMGMQGRPASGPGPLISAIEKIARIRDSQMKPWRQTMYVDHYISECVLVGGARRAARMTTKFWKDRDILEFIQVKRGGFLWSSNNSVTVDRQFWACVRKVWHFKTVEVAYTPEEWKTRGYLSDLDLRAWTIFNAVCEAAYYDNTGEPGFINQDKLTENNDGLEMHLDGSFFGSSKYRPDSQTLPLLRSLAGAVLNSPYKTIVNPCCVPGETFILTDKGHKRIDSLVNQKVNVWNGFKFSEVEPFSVGVQNTMTVELSDGTSLRCTPNHKFVLHGAQHRPQGERKEAQHLKIGDKLAKYKMPVVESGEEYGTPDEAYSQGFYSGDGNHNLHTSWLYPPKYVCADRLIGKVAEKEVPSSARKTWAHGPMKAKSWVPIDGSLSYCLNWLAGLLDSDGTVTRDINGNGFQIVAVDKEFLLKVRLMLTRLGVKSKVVKCHKAGFRSMPDGKGGHKDYYCKETRRLLIGNMGVYQLGKIGLKTERLEWHGVRPDRDACQFVRVISVSDDEPCENFCFEEPENHTGTFDGIVTGQSEISLNMLGGFCVLGSVVPYYAQNDDDAEDAFRTVVRSLIRVNLMDSVYKNETRRTNRIGPSIVGIHEYAWSRFGYGWKDLVDEERSKDFWLMLSRFKRAVVDEARRYAEELGVAVPHTDATIVPAGSISKLFGLTEGAHLPAMAEFLRWVQFRNDDPLVNFYRDRGYPVKKLQVYKGHTIVGFPTQPEICKLGMGDKMVTAGQATMAEQYEYLRLLEKYWIVGVNIDGQTPLRESGNQISYTLKYRPEQVSFDLFQQMLLENQSTVRCCAVMPQIDTSAYEYTPESALDKAAYERVAEAIERATRGQSIQEEVTFEQAAQCEGGACPVSWNENSAAA